MTWYGECGYRTILNAVSHWLKGGHWHLLGLCNSIPYHFMALFYVPFYSLTVLQKTKRKRSHRTTIFVRRRGDVMAVSSAQASDPDNRRTCAFMCFSILCMRSSAKLIPYGAVLNRCMYMYRAVMNRTVSRSRIGVQP